jgi:hypothetical protein
MSYSGAQDENGAEDNQYNAPEIWKGCELHRQVEQSEPVKNHRHKHLTRNDEANGSYCAQAWVSIIDVVT